MNSLAAEIREIGEKPVQGDDGTKPFARWRGAVEILLLALLALAIGFSGFRAGWSHLNSDFPNYYTAAKLYRQNIPLDRAYEWTWFQREAIRIGVIEQPLVGFVPQPPLNLVPVLPLVNLSPLVAKRVWLGFTVLLLMLDAWLVADVTKLRLRVAGIVTLACVGPLAANFRLGQYYVLILTLLLLAYREFLRGKKFRAGAILAVAGGLKLFPFGFVVLLIVRREWRALAGVVTTGFALAMVSVWLFGLEVHRVLIAQVLPRAIRGELLAPYAVSSFLGLFRHLFLFEPQLNPFPLFRSAEICALLQACAVVAMLALLIAALSKKDLPVPLAWGLTALWLSAMSALAVSYHYSVLIFPVALVLGHLRKTENWNLLVEFAVAYAGGCLFIRSNLALWVGTTTMFAMLLCSIWWERASRRQIAKWTVAVAALIAILTFSNLRVLHGRERDYERRTADSQSGSRAANPNAANGTSVAFSQMYKNGYRAVLSSGTGEQMIEQDGRILTLAGSLQSRYLYLEVAGNTSNIFRIDVSDNGKAAEWVTNGSSPSVSPNGHWLVFLRERQGRNQFFRQRIDPASEPELIATRDDILEAAVNDGGSVIASAGRSSRARLILFGSGAPIELASSARYPAWSPDGRKLAFSRLHGEWWQIYMRDLESGVERQLTDLPCNAVDASWNGEDDLLFSSDCGRGLGLSAISRITIHDRMAIADQHFLQPHD